MTDEQALAKMDALVQELKELGVEDMVLAAGNNDGFFAVKYGGDYRGVAYLAMSALMNIMFDSMTEIVMEMNKDGREDHC